MFTLLPYEEEGLEGLRSMERTNSILRRWTRRFSKKIRARALDAERRGIYICVMLFNGWSVEKKSPTIVAWKRHPFNRENNVNHIDGDANGDGEGVEVHTLRNPAITADTRDIRRKGDRLNQ